MRITPPTTTSTAPVRTVRFNSLIFPCRHMAISTSKRCQHHHLAYSSVRCALLRSNGRQSRRLLTGSLLFLHCVYIPKDAMGASIFEKYMKKKKLDPLEAYIPAVVLAGFQIQELGKFLEAENPPQYADYRNILRSGPAASLRVNIRAVAQYASDDGGDGKSASKNVDQCLRALEELDSLLLHASRNEPNASIDSMKSKIQAALSALDGLLSTVPSDVLARGKAIANEYQTQEQIAPDNSNPDPELKQLEALL